MSNILPLLRSLLIPKIWVQGSEPTRGVLVTYPGQRSATFQWGCVKCRINPETGLLCVEGHDVNLFTNGLPYRKKGAHSGPGHGAVSGTLYIASGNWGREPSPYRKSAGLQMYGLIKNLHVKNINMTAEFVITSHFADLKGLGEAEDATHMHAAESPKRTSVVLIPLVNLPGSEQQVNDEQEEETNPKKWRCYHESFFVALEYRRNRQQARVQEKILVSPKSPDLMSNETSPSLPEATTPIRANSDRKRGEKAAKTDEVVHSTPAKEKTTKPSTGQIAKSKKLRAEPILIMPSGGRSYADVLGELRGGTEPISRRQNKNDIGKIQREYDLLRTGVQ
ncbi:hypothetical protein J6590_093000 [Homalodisca vitripennis]|nr:hypothetical protein J6590_093000 [Homalodisca vitripennis]